MNATKTPSLNGGPGACGGVCRSLVRNPAGMELPLRRLLCSLTGRDSGLDLALEGRGTLHAVGGSSSPRRARTAT